MTAYARPESLERLLLVYDQAGAGAKLLAGGTDLMIAIRAGRRFPALINLSRVPELSLLSVGKGRLEIGAAVTVARLLRDRAVREHAPLLWQAADRFASPLVRSRATVGGNLCNASPAADLSLALLALDAELHLASVRGVRVLSVASFLLGPGKTALEEGELVRSVAIPIRAGRLHFFQKSGTRPALEIAVASVAVALSLEGGVVADPRICCGAVAPFPMRAREAETALAGQRLSSERMAASARAAGLEVRPIDDVRGTALYRRRLIAAFVSRSLSQALDASRSPHAAS